uniref:Tudor domain-containing protein n=1 Tax=Timema genevievae TaxID=629358 RepID=A0A7R9PP96_TIMGE|nr:unnamed protein product [Timema genevievae]
MDRRVIIKGSVEQISLAKSMIEEKVEEDSEERRNIERSMASRSPRQHPNKQYLTSAAQEEVVMSSVVWGLSSGKLTGPYVVVTTWITLGLRSEYCVGCPPNTAWPKPLLQLTPYCPLAPYCQMLLASHCPAFPRAVIQKRRKRERPSSTTLTIQEVLKKEKSGHLERLVPTGKDGFMEVYVSAVEGPSQFWLQVYGPRAIELDHLEMQMTDYYKIEENRKLHAIKEGPAFSLVSGLPYPADSPMLHGYNVYRTDKPFFDQASKGVAKLARSNIYHTDKPFFDQLEEGQIVAAPFLYDNKWYRAEVAKVTLDDYNVEDSKVCLYYVDYGDSSTRYKHEVCELRTDFLRLRFQAIECCLARVKPR